MQSKDNGRGPLEIICELAAQACHAEVACVVHCVGKQEGQILGAVGTSAKRLAGNTFIPSLDNLSRPMVKFERLKSEKWFASHALFSIAPDAKRMHVVSIPSSESGQTFIAVLAEGGQRLVSDVPRLLKLAVLASAIIEARIGQTITVKPILSDAQLGFHEPKEAVGADAILSFLARTMPKLPALKGREDFAYLVIRRWKSNFKDVQLAAIKGLKISPSAETVMFAVNEIVESVEKLFSKTVFSCVVPVPGSSSGSVHGLSTRIAEQVAAAMGLPFNDCLSGDIVIGSSHPRKSAKLKPYSVTKHVSGQVLLVDDIATTGTHLMVARHALREAGASVFAVTWIGG